YVRVQYALGTANVMLIMAAITSTFVLSFPEREGFLNLWNSFGLSLLIIPLKKGCEMYGRKAWGRVLMVALSIVSVVFAFGNVAKVSWALALSIFMFPALFAPRPESRVLMATPQVWHSLLYMALYGLGRATFNANLSFTAVILLFFFLLAFMVDRNVDGCLKKVRSAKGEVEVDGILSSNRRAILIFVLLFALFSLLLPSLLSFLSEERVKTEVQYEPGVTGFEEKKEKGEVPIVRDKGISGESKALDYSALGNVLLALFLFALALALLLVVYAVISRILNIEAKSGKHRERSQADFTVLPLEKEKRKERREKLSLFSSRDRIRHRYKAFVSSLSGVDKSSMTAGEIRENILPGNEASRLVTEIYEKARYSLFQVGREEERAMGKAIKECLEKK
ncbi:MAG: hypothetical protein KIG41_08420, partial [Sphaerochaetaceae bacterium]|nr:hypothetical protein [Sphaerochaetaceae bacterium]